MSKKDTRLYMRASSELRERLDKASEVLDTPASQIIREAIDEKLAKLAKRHPALRPQEQPAEAAA